MATNRILILAPQPFYEDRGTPIAIRYLLEALSESKCDVDLLTYPMGEKVSLNGLRTFRVGSSLSIKHVSIGLSWQKLLLDAVLIPKLCRQLKIERYSCIHAVEETAFPAIVAGWWYHIPVIYDMQSSLPEQLMQYRLCRPAVIQWGLRWCERWLLRHVDYVVCSAGLLHWVREIAPGARAQEWRFPSRWTDVTTEQVNKLRTQLAIASDTRIVLYTGNFEDYQGISILLEAIPQVLSVVPKTLFLLVGKHDVAGLAVSARTTDFLRRGVLQCLPRQPKSVIPTFLAMADVVVSPRMYGSNVGIKVFEYLSSGKPIVATDSHTHRTVLDENRAVLVGLSPEEIAKAIVRLLRHPQEASRLGNAARAYAREYLSWPAFLEQVAQLYDRGRGAGKRGRRQTASSRPYRPEQKKSRYAHWLKPGRK